MGKIDGLYPRTKGLKLWRYRFSTHQVLVEILADVRRQLEGAHEDEEEAQQYGEALQHDRIGCRRHLGPVMGKYSEGRSSLGAPSQYNTLPKHTGR